MVAYSHFIFDFHFSLIALFYLHASLFHHIYEKKKKKKSRLVVNLVLIIWTKDD
jgi:hypothetical protein